MWKDLAVSVALMQLVSTKAFASASLVQHRKLALAAMRCIDALVRSPVGSSPGVTTARYGLNAPRMLLVLMHQPTCFTTIAFRLLDGMKGAFLGVAFGEVIPCLPSCLPFVCNCSPPVCALSSADCCRALDALLSSILVGIQALTKQYSDSVGKLPGLGDGPAALMHLLSAQEAVFQDIAFSLLLCVYRNTTHDMLWLSPALYTACILMPEVRGSRCWFAAVLASSMRHVARLAWVWLQVMLSSVRDLSVVVHPPKAVPAVLAMFQKLLSDDALRLPYAVHRKEEFVRTLFRMKRGIPSEWADDASVALVVDDGTIAV